jgi:7-carboxy-7-deazaguanine synthase
MINIQPIEKRVVSDGEILDIHSIFWTIQGEGPFTGTPAVFIRLAGCNLQCPGCDTDYTVGRQEMTLGTIIAKIENILVTNPTYINTPLIVITGGEPFRQNLSPLLWQLQAREFPVQIETNGSLALLKSDCLVNWDKVTIVCSPKTGKVNPVIAAHAACYKYVLSHDSVSFIDGLPLLALHHPASPKIARPTRKLPIYLQPMDSQNAITNYLNLQAVIKSCMTFGYILQLQVHKILELE